jgi:hypothetical protein
LGDNENRDIPTLSPNLRGIIQISVGTSGVLYLDKRGRVWGSGIPDPDGVVSNYYPGKIPGLDNITQVSTGVDHFLFIKK